MKLTQEQQLGYSLIELRIVIQRAIELIDDINRNDAKFGNKKLASQMKSVYGPLDKETRKYNDIFEASEEGTTAFYNITKEATNRIMNNSLPDKSIICQALASHEINPKAVEGIFKKILA